MTNRHSLCQFSRSVLNRFFWDVAVRHRTFGSGCFVRTQRAHLPRSTVHDDTRNGGNEISSDALSRPIAEGLERPVGVSLICWCRSVLQATYRDATMGSGLMEPEGEGRPLLSLQDLESRLVFTRCKVSTRTAGHVHLLLLLLSCVCASLAVKIRTDYCATQQHSVVLVTEMKCVFCE